MKGLGFNHIDLATRDMEATRSFYEDLLGFPLVRADLVEIGDQGLLKHFFFDIGNGQLLGFMSGEDVAGYPKDFDAGINKGLGLATGVYHFAFNADSLEMLEATKKQLEAHGVEVRGPVDHEGWSKSIYFRDPNGLQLECCHLTRPFEADDAVPRVRFRLEGRVKKRPDGTEEHRAGGGHRGGGRSGPRPGTVSGAAAPGPARARAGARSADREPRSRGGASAQAR